MDPVLLYIKDWELMFQHQGQDTVVLMLQHEGYWADVTAPTTVCWHFSIKDTVLT